MIEVLLFLGIFVEGAFIVSILVLTTSYVILVCHKIQYDYDVQQLKENNRLLEVHGAGDC